MLFSDISFHLFIHLQKTYWKITLFMLSFSQILSFPLTLLQWKKITTFWKKISWNLFAGKHFSFPVDMNQLHQSMLWVILSMFWQNKLIKQQLEDLYQSLLVILTKTKTELCHGNHSNCPERDAGGELNTAWHQTTPSSTHQNSKLTTGYMEDNQKQVHLQLIWPMSSFHFYGNMWMAVWGVTHSRMEKWRHCGCLGENWYLSVSFFGSHW